MSAEVKAKWEAMQIKTFTNWCNMHLSKRGESIQSLTEDFRDGVKLVTLLEVIGDANLGKINKKPKMKLQMIENLNRALAFIKERGISLVGIGSEDINEGNVKLTLGMIWMLILRFAISDLSEEGLSAKQGLLIWCQKKTKGYRDVDVQDFQDSFKDGLAFCAIIHKHRPDLIDYDSLSKDNARENLDLAFDVAEKNLGIPKLLDTDDMVNLPRPDERSVMTYCAALYKVFSAYDKVELAGQHVGKFVELMKSINDMQHDYERRARELIDWVNATNEKFSTPVPEISYDEVRELISGMRDYRRGEKATHVAEQGELAALLNSIQVKLKSMNRASYVPPEGLATADIDAAITKLEAAERQHRSELNARLRKIRDDLRHEFADLANKFNEMLEGFRAFLGEDAGGDFAEQKAAYEAKRAELAGHEGDLSAMQECEARCEACNIEENEYTDFDTEDLRTAFAQLLKTMDKKIAFLGAQELESQGGISAEKMLEYTQSFDFFDKDHNHTLERVEFFGCLAAIGLSNVDFTGQDEAAERLFKQAAEGGDVVTLDQYIKFINTIVSDSFDPKTIADNLRIISDGKDWITEADMGKAGFSADLISYITAYLPHHPSCPDGYDFSIWCQ